MMIMMMKMKIIEMKKKKVLKIMTMLDNEKDNNRLIKRDKLVLKETNKGMMACKWNKKK